MLAYLYHGPGLLMQEEINTKFQQEEMSKFGAKWMNEVLRVCSLPVDYITRSICSAYAAWNFYFYQEMSLKKILSLTFPNMPLKFF